MTGMTGNGDVADKKEKRMDVLAALIGPIMIVIGILVFRKSRLFVKSSTVIPGEVVEIQKRPAQRGRTAYYPIVRYHDPFTETDLSFESPNPYESDKYHPGDKVELRYMNEGTKKRVCLNNWSALWALPVLLVAFGAVFTGIAALIYFGNR